MKHRSTPPFHIRRASVRDRVVLVDIWRRSAQATHTFLTAPEIAALHRDVEALGLERMDTWVLCAPSSLACGFLVMDGHDVAGLFIAPEWLRCGGGRLLLRHARSLAAPLTVAVNEPNRAALAFYLAEGFVLVGRSETDGAGRPYPLLHLAEPGGNKSISAEV
jgi:putative acetyltransferase